MLTRLIMVAVMLTVAAVMLNTPKQDRHTYIKRYWPLVALLILCVLALFKKVSWLALLVGLVTLGLHAALKHLDILSVKKTSQQKQSHNRQTIDNAMSLFSFTQKPTSRQDVIVRHRQLIAQHHPDKGGDPNIASEINHARDVLLALFD